MNERTHEQTGSPSRDKFKRRHKDLNKQFYACDLDFVFVTKSPTPDVIAIIDYKASADSVTFAEVIAYNALTRRGIDVYIVQGDVDTGVFDIRRYVGGHHLKPRYETQPITKTANWQEFETWEHKLRGSFAHRYRS